MKINEIGAVMANMNLYVTMKRRMNKAMNVPNVGHLNAVQIFPEYYW